MEKTMGDNKEILISDYLNRILENQDKLQSRVLGLDMCLKGLTLMFVLDGGDVKDKITKANVLKDILTSLQEGLAEQEFMVGIDQTSFFSSAKGLTKSIDDVIEQLEKTLGANHG